MCLFTGSKSTIQLSVAVEGLAQSLRIGEVLGSNICFEVIYSDCIFLWFSTASPGKCRGGFPTSMLFTNHFLLTSL